jgi:ribosomal protein S18 acetylase RimI-like enzyme
VRNSEPALRRAASADASAVADVWLRSFTAALPTVRRGHSDDQVRDWIRDVVVPGPETWVATVDGVVAAMMVIGSVVDDAGDVEQLYVDPSFQNRSLGSRLIRLAKSRCPAGLELWTFQVNESAQRFYEQHGFVAVERTDGHDNEEHEPDVRYAWRPASLAAA